ncbi:MAG: HNH endonuclease [Dongiaceae bacterium]
MAKAILTTKIDSAYDDLPEERYHFPRTYLRQVQAALNDWIIYYEPRRVSADLSSRGGRQAYFATARISRIAADPLTPDHFYAYVSDYLEFDRAVPFREGSSYYESQLRRDDGETSKGAFGRAVRPISDSEYDLIVHAGFVRTLRDVETPAATRGRQVVSSEMAEDPQAPFERPIVERLVARPFREAAFATSVKSAYSETCAMTGLRIINGGGRAEVQAAHIRPVSDGGSDSIRNGLALSGTAHWMFDRGLLSIADDYTILAAEKQLPREAIRLIRPNRKLIFPERLDARPHPAHLRYHRERVFKG